jgi:hypothetical protein
MEPPTICYIPQSGCLVSAEKHLSSDHFGNNAEKAFKGEDPSVPPTLLGTKNNQSSYEKFSKRHN